MELDKRVVFVDGKFFTVKEKESEVWVKIHERYMHVLTGVDPLLLYLR